MNQNIEQLIQATLEGPAMESPAIALALGLLRASTPGSTAKAAPAPPPRMPAPSMPTSSPVDPESLQGLLPATTIEGLRQIQPPALCKLRTLETIEAVAAPLRSDLETLWPLILHYAPGALSDETLRALMPIGPDENPADRLRDLQTAHKAIPSRIASAIEEHTELDNNRRQSVAGAVRSMNGSEILRESERLVAEVPEISPAESGDAATLFATVNSLGELLAGKSTPADVTPALAELPREMREALQEIENVSASAGAERSELLKQWIERFSAQIPDKQKQTLRRQAEDPSIDVGTFGVKLREALSGKDPQAEAAETATTALSRAASVLSPAELASHAGHLHAVIGRWWSLPEQEGARAFGEALKKLEKAEKKAADVPADPEIVQQLQMLASLTSLPQSSTAKKLLKTGSEKETVDELWADAVGAAHGMALAYLDPLPEKARTSKPVQTLSQALEDGNPETVMKSLENAQKKQSLPVFRKPGVRLLAGAVVFALIVVGAVAWKQMAGSGDTTYTLEFATPESYRSLAVYREGEAVETHDVSGPELKLTLPPGSYQLFLDDAFSGIEIQSPQPAGASPIRVE